MFDHSMTSSITSIAARAFPIAMIAATLGPLCVGTQGAETADELALNAIFGDEFVAENVAFVRRRARQLEASERYQFIADWVLPSKTHSTIRMNGQFASTGLYCPAIELIEVAQQIGYLQQLRERVAQLPDSGLEAQRRVKAAMLFMVDLSSGDDSAAAESVLKLSTPVESSTELAPSRLWPQTVAAWYGLRNPKGWPLVGELVTEMRIRYLLEGEESGSAVWSEQLASMNGLLQLLSSQGSAEDFAQPPLLKNWIAASAVTARSHAAGFPRDHWRWDGRQLQNLSSHGQSLLFYRIPLRGNFEVSCELPVESFYDIQMMYAGEYMIPQEDLLADRIGIIRQERLEPLNPPMTKPSGPPWFRIQVRDNVCTSWFNGRLVRRRILAADHDPWLAIRATSSRLHPTIRDLRIDGMPSTPGEVNLCADETLNGWWSYFDEPIGPGLAWQHIHDEAGNGLQGKLQADYRGARKESLLCYYRPLAVDDSVEYEFFYEPERTHVHPALDGLAFLLHPGGVSVHPVTDGKYGPSEADPAASAVEPDCRRGPAKLPLQAAAWNRCRLTVRAGAVDVSVNDQLIYSRPLEAAGQRLFGFFHDAGEGEVQVRNVMWRHRPVRPFETIEQQLVNRAPHPLDSKLDRLRSFTHDFATSGLPLDLFEIPSGGDVKVSVIPGGVTHSQRSGGKWSDSSIVPRFQMRGDFDLTAGFADLRVTDYGGAAVVIRGEGGRLMQLSRRLREGNLHRVYLTWRDPVGDGEYRMIKELLITEALAGRFRVARRGDTYSFLIAEYDSPVFRLAGQQTLDGAGRQAAQVELRAIASLGGSASVLWKDLQLAAEELTRLSFRAAGRDLTNEDWSTIVNADRLEELSLDGTNVSDDDLAKLKDHLTLRLLYLKSTQITSRGVLHLAKLTQLEKLHLTSSRVDDDAAVTIGQLSELRSLGLSYTRVGDAGVSHLSRLPKLQVLGLSRTAVTDESVASFSKMNSLRTLTLRGTAVSEAGVERIRKALPKCTISY